MQFLRFVIKNIVQKAPKMNWGIKKWIRSIQQKEGPTGMLINPVGFPCNHKCPMCWRETAYRDQTALKEMLRNETIRLHGHEYKNIFEHMPWTISSVTITGGGEPLLHPEIKKIMSLIKTYGYSGYLITNGTLITDDLLSFMHEITWDYVRISLHTSDKDTFTSIHGVDEFSKITSLLSRIQKRKLVDKSFRTNIGLFFAIQSKNYRKLLHFCKFAEKYAVDEIIFGELMPINPELSLDERQIDSVISGLTRISRRRSIKNNAKELIQKYRLMKKREQKISSFSKKFHPYKQCNLPEIYLNSTGNVYPCCFLTQPHHILGNVRNHPFNHILTSSNYFQIKKEVSSGHYRKECYKYCTLL